MLKIDEQDIKILKVLQERGMKSYRDILRYMEPKLALGTIARRIRKLTESGVIKGYTAILDPSKLGYKLTALILIQAEGVHLVEVEKEIASLPNVCAVYDITGEFDAAVIARFKNREGLNEFIKSIIANPYVKRTVTNVVLNVVKEDFKVNLEA